MLLRHAITSGGSSPTYVDDVFSTYLYTGNGSTQTITNGIDLAGKGGLVWVKKRNAATSHALIDTVRGLSSGDLDSASTSGAAGDVSPAFNFTSSGFSLLNTWTKVNNNGDTYASFTFRKAAKFFDVVTYTGNGGTKSITHGLGITPGFLIIKRTDSTSNWLVIAKKSAGNIYGLYLNSTASQFYDGTEPFSALWNASTVSIDIIDGSIASGFNLNGAQYVAYLFAHDTSASGIIQAGSFTTPASGYGTVNIGYEPQWLMVKRVDAAQNWHIFDTMRPFNVQPNSSPLFPNTSGAESSGYTIFPTATGFQIDSSFFGANASFIYVAIRRPNKPPTTGTQVYNAIARTGTGAAATVTGVGFAPDLSVTKDRSNAVQGVFYDRLRGAGNLLDPTATDAEVNTSDGLTAFGIDGVSVGANATYSRINVNTHTYINYFFKRAPGVFDIVASTDATGVSSINHGLGVVPELIISKWRSTTGNWEVSVYSGGVEKGLTLNSTAAWSNTGGTLPTNTVFYPQSLTNGNTRITYLFATKAGISKVGSFTGNGTSQTINCGFAAGCRFFLVKATSTTGSWWVWDSTRGVVASTDFGLQLNSTAAETTSADAVDPDASGIIVNQEATCSINANGVSYIYLAIA